MFRRLCNRLFGWKYVMFRFNCDGEVKICRLFDTDSGPAFRAGIHGIHFAEPNGVDRKSVV